MNQPAPPAAPQDGCPSPLAPGSRLALARYRLQFAMLEAIRLPAWTEPLLRGQFGSALRRSVCVTGASTCEGCALHQHCAYPGIFDTPAPSEHRLQKFSQVPNPYILEAPECDRVLQPGATLSFNVVAIGRAWREWPLVVSAFKRALSLGLGPRRAKGELRSIDLEGPDGTWHKLSTAPGRGTAEARHWLELPAFEPCQQVRLHFRTPLRLQTNGRPLKPEELTPRVLLTQLMRRITLIGELHLGFAPGFAEREAILLANLANTLTDSRHLHWHEHSRYSSRQKQRMTLGGVVGEWVLQGELQQFMPALWLGQWLHAGKNATLGFGGYRMEALV